MKRLYVISYDVPDDTRRIKLAALLKSYGERVQLSVFECYLDESLLSDLKARARRLLDLTQDSLRIYSVSGKVEVLGVGPFYEVQPFIVT
ncbi:CRISPR-associated endonuclease Cas2 [Thermus igniterrae]|uniref:CRISPR-associated endonuclease Cas2 n=1 Tax=Thermus igniterrae TaxID=88189 RepID=UPI0009FFD41C|nr:CRISPR-associated endonuclease Cas2 [Thermus igniterrae]